jgi:DNA-binding CsgD family transcriptional regulator
LLRDIRDLETGRFESFRARRALSVPGGDRSLFWVTMRTVEMSAEHLEVAIFAPEGELGQLGRHPVRVWMDLVPICLGIVDRQWKIRSISAEVYELLGRMPAECIGTHLLDWVDPANKAGLAEATTTDLVPRLFRHVRLSAAENTTVGVCIMVAPATPEEKDLFHFAIVGTLEDYLPLPKNRVSDLEMRLRRIGAEVRAAGIMESVGGLPKAARGAELTDLTTRQWEILTSLVQGQRVSTIAKELYISPSTVRNHLSVIFKKFGVHNQAELIEKVQEDPRL